MNNEQTLILIKPNFTKVPVIIAVQKAINNTNLITKCSGFANFSYEEAKEFYINKKDTPFYNELANYLSSEKIYGFVVCGDNAITKIKSLATLLRTELPNTYNLKTDVMRNVVHASSLDDGKQKVQNEINLFLKNKR